MTFCYNCRYNTTKQLPDSQRRILELERKNEAVTAGCVAQLRNLSFSFFLFLSLSFSFIIFLQLSSSFLTHSSQRLLICERSLKLQVSLTVCA